MTVTTVCCLSLTICQTQCDFKIFHLFFVVMIIISIMISVISSAILENLELFLISASLLLMVLVLVVVEVVRYFSQLQNHVVHSD